ncbi:MAG: GyrI-like domain-containing protein, partial [Bacteroidota bacterium]
PMGMETYTISGGTYAVFVHKGPASTFGNTMGYIFNVWMPKSGYRLDGREHFEILTETYRPNDPDAKEEVWVPVMKV